MKQHAVTVLLIVIFLLSLGIQASAASGWNKAQLKQATNTCTSAILRVIEQYPDLITVPSEKRTRNPYKTKDFKPSVKKLCKCVVKNMSRNVSYEHYAARPSSDLSYDFSRALNSGQCKPTGLISKIR